MMKTNNLENRSIGELLSENAITYPNRVAKVYADQAISYTWKELDILVTRIARGFYELGIRKGDHIAIWATNIPEWYFTQLAAARLGCPLVTINPEWKLEELRYALKQSDSKLLVMSPGFTKHSRSGDRVYDYIAIINELIPSLADYRANTDLQIKELPVLKYIIQVSPFKVNGMYRWDDIISEEVILPDLEVPASSIAMIQYTSGTTGFPKGAMLTHLNVLNNAKAGAQHMSFTNRDILCGPVPYYHCFGSILVNLIGLVTGATVVIPNDTFDAEKTLQCVQKYRCTALHGVPTMFMSEVILEKSKHYDTSSLRTGIIAGAPVERELMESVIEDLGALEMTIGYGLTEASPLTHQTDRFDPIDRRVESVGKPITNSESKIVDPNTHNELPVNSVGEIWVKGSNVMMGYYNQPKETDYAIVDGWLRTGDLGYKDEEGYYHISGRLKEMLIVGGHNVYPAEVEHALYDLLHDKVEQLYVFGVDDDRFQEVVGIAVKCLPGEEVTLDEIRDRAEGRMEWSKIPRHLIPIDDFSDFLTVTGKVQKFKLRKYYKDNARLVKESVLY